MRSPRYFAALALLLLTASVASADIALPESMKTRRKDEIRRDLPHTRMTIEAVQGLREARLQVPRTQLGSLAAAAGLEEGGAAGARSGSLGAAGTVIGGLFLSLSVVLTGLLLLRARRRVAGVRTAALLVCAGLTAAGAGLTAAYANAGPPPGYSAQDPGTLIRAVSGKALNGSVRIEVVDEGNEIKLLVPARPPRSKGEDEEE